MDTRISNDGSASSTLDAAFQAALNKPPIDPSLLPVRYLSPALQRKLLKRAKKQRKQFRSSGKPYPLVHLDSPLVTSEKGVNRS